MALHLYNNHSNKNLFLLLAFPLRLQAVAGEQTRCSSSSQADVDSLFGTKASFSFFYLNSAVH